MVIHGKFGKSATALCWFTIICCVIMDSSVRPKIFSEKQDAAPEHNTPAQSSESLAIPTLMAFTQTKAMGKARLEHSKERPAATLSLSSL